MSLHRFYEKFLLSLKRESFTSVGQESEKLKTTIIAKAMSVVIACLFLALFLVPAGFASKGGMPGDEAATLITCGKTLGAFTVFPSARLNINQKGSVSGFEIHLSNVDGGCSVMIYASNDAGYDIDLSDHRDSDEMTIAWR
jgi:hypothetical protein